MQKRVVQDSCGSKKSRYVICIYENSIQHAINTHRHTDTCKFGISFYELYFSLKYFSHAHHKLNPSHVWSPYVPDTYIHIQDHFGTLRSSQDVPMHSHHFIQWLQLLWSI